ncbi:acyltransferase [Streptomyces sp. S1D4-11]
MGALPDALLILGPLLLERVMRPNLDEPMFGPEALARRSAANQQLRLRGYYGHLEEVDGGSTTVQYHLAGRGLFAAPAWATVSVAVVPLAFLLAAGLRRLPGFRRVL